MKQHASLNMEAINASVRVAGLGMIAVKILMIVLTIRVSMEARVLILSVDFHVCALPGKGVCFVTWMTDADRTLAIRMQHAKTAKPMAHSNASAQRATRETIARKTSMNVKVIFSILFKVPRETMKLYFSRFTLSLWKVCEFSRIFHLSLSARIQRRTLRSKILPVNLFSSHLVYPVRLQLTRREFMHENCS